MLLIEDSADARERLRLTLERAGHLVYDAADVERGLELLKTVRPDVGIIDISTPAVDRGRIAKRFRQARHGRNMLLVALGLSRSPTDASGPAKDGFDFHVPKPVDGEHLAHLLRAAAVRARPASAVSR